MGHDVGQPRRWDKQSEKERKAAYRARLKAEQAAGDELEDVVVETVEVAELDEASFAAAFPARANDLRPSDAQLKKLGATVGTR